MTTNMLIPVTAMPLVDPGRARIDVELPHGLTVAEIIATVLPGASNAVMSRVRVALVTKQGEWIVSREAWSRAKPRAGVHIVIRVVPGKDGLRSVLMLVVAIAAAAIANFFIPGSGAFAATWIGSALKVGITLGVTALGGLLVNALLPPDTADKSKEKPVFAISGWKNNYAPNAPVPDVQGFIRYAPPFGAFSYMEVVGDIIYSRAVFLVGYGPVEFDAHKLGDTLLSKYDEAQLEVRQGFPDDAPLTLYTSQVIEQSVGTDITRPQPRNDAGNVIDGPAIDTPVSRFTGADVSGVNIILSFPSGMIKIDDKARESSNSIELRIRYRLVGVEEWTVEQVGLKISAKKREGFFRAYAFEFPVRGAYEVELDRMDPERANSNTYVEKCTWVVLQSFRPEYPFNFDKPLALVALRIKATYQLNGTLDNYNCMVKRIAPDWDGDDWVEGVTQNPAALARRVLQGPANAFPAADAEMDLPAFEAWHEFCATKELAYNRVHDFDASMQEVLAAIGAAGRAVVRHNGRKWTVIIDQPRDLVIEHVNPRNSAEFKWSQTYFRPPHAIRVPFLDETNEYQQGERLIPWPPEVKKTTRASLYADLDHPDGYRAQVTDDPTPEYNTYYEKLGASGSGVWQVASFDLTEEMQHPGKTHPDEIWIETRRRQYELIYRSTSYSAVQQGAARTATSGDLVMASQDVLVRAMHSGRVKAIREENQVEVDEIFTMEEGGSYAIRFRKFDEEDTVGTSVVRTIETHAGETTNLLVTGSGDMPGAGDLIHFGPAALDSIPLIVAGIERGKDNSSILHMLPSAEIIDELTDAEVPPTWSGRVGIDLGGSNAEPAAPIFTSVDSGLVTTDSPTDIVVTMKPGAGSPAVIKTYNVEHRLQGDSTWLGPVAATAIEAAVTLDMYELVDAVEIRANATSINNVDGSYTATVTVTVGSDDFRVTSTGETRVTSSGEARAIA